MNENHKIIVIDKEEELGHKISEVLESWNHGQNEVLWFSSFVVEEIRGAFCVIMDARMVKDVKNLMEVLNALAVKKIILVTNELNHPLSSSAIMMGATVFYRHSPITTLMTKVFNSYKPDGANRLSKKSKPKMFSKKGNSKVESSSKIVTVYSPKGGTGKTSLIINVATHFSMKNLRVLVVDLCVYGNIGLKLKIDQQSSGLSNVLYCLNNNGYNSSFDEVVRKSIYSYANGSARFDVLVSDSPEEMSKLDGEDLESIVGTIANHEYDVILFDTSSEHTQLNVGLFGLSTDILLIATPDTGSTWNLINNRELMQSLNVVDKCKLVVNKFKNNVGFSFRELETELQYPLISVIPEHNEIRIAENNGKIISLDKEEHINTFYKQVGHSIVSIFSPEDIRLNKKKFSFDLMKTFDGIKKMVKK